ncbi:hypothetical protein Bbelb_267560 [Branchiostoma belcheri]|nr:hypothetical protein Bbelb_267560 [Branchiostoma belcheri]
MYVRRKTIFMIHRRRTTFIKYAIAGPNTQPWGTRAIRSYYLRRTHVGLSGTSDVFAPPLVGDDAFEKAETGTRQYRSPLIGPDLRVGTTTCHRQRRDLFYLPLQYKWKIHSLVTKPIIAPECYILSANSGEDVGLGSYNRFGNQVRKYKP